MGLIKTVEWKGLNVEYWIIFRHHYDKINDRVSVWITPYKNKATRVLDINNNIKELNKMYDFAGDLTVEQCYNLIKQQSYFNDAIDEL